MTDTQHPAARRGKDRDKQERGKKRQRKEGGRGGNKMIERGRTGSQNGSNTTMGGWISEGTGLGQKET